MDALELLALGRLEVVADEILEIGLLAVLAHRRSSPSSSARRRSADRVRVLTVPSGMLRYVGDLALRQAAPVRQLDQRALLLRQFLERTVDAPRRPIRAPRLVRPGPRRGHVRAPRPRPAPRAPAKAVDDRVARDGVEPDVASPRAGSNRDAERQMLVNVSWVASSARPRSPIRRNAMPSTERAYRRWSSSNAGWSPAATSASSSASVRLSVATRRMLSFTPGRGQVDPDRDRRVHIRVYGS